MPKTQHNINIRNHYTSSILSEQKYLTLFNTCQVSVLSIVCHFDYCSGNFLRAVSVEYNEIFQRNNL